MARYVDDIFVLFPNDHDDYLIPLNMLSDSIKFTAEVECYLIEYVNAVCGINWIERAWFSILYLNVLQNLFTPQHLYMTYHVCLVD